MSEESTGKERDMIAGNDEEKRSRIWEIITIVSTVLIIVIVAFFLIKMFTSNPLEGKWKSEDSGLLMTIDKNSVVLEWPEEFVDSGLEISLSYRIDKDTKTFTLIADEAALQEAIQESDDTLTEEELSSSVDTLAATYDYNVENRKLTLTDREYGEQMIFDKQ